MNWLMPLSLAAGTLLTAVLVHRATAPGIGAFQQTGLVFLIAMVALGVIEHAMLVMPLPFAALWSWWLCRRSGAAAQAQTKRRSDLRLCRTLIGAR